MVVLLSVKNVEYLVWGSGIALTTAYKALVTGGLVSLSSLLVDVLGLSAAS